MPRKAAPKKPAGPKEETPRRSRRKKADTVPPAALVARRRASRREESPSEPPPPVPGPADLLAAVETLRALGDRLAEGWRSVAHSIDELPRVSDFQPLADHLYEFARTAPELLESLRKLPAALDPVKGATRTLTEIADGLQNAQSSLQDALFHLPRPSEYEPLAEPLRDFARLSPSLRESLAGVPPLAAALDCAAQRLEAAAERIETGSMPPLTAGTGPEALAVSPAVIAMRLERVGRSIDAARDAVRLALASLPTSADYAPAAARLREIASVSPTLLEWMEQDVPQLTTPLADSVDALRTAARSLDGAFVDLELTRRDLRGGE
jgi:hypothetical protein